MCFENKDTTFGRVAPSIPLSRSSVIYSQEVDGGGGRGDGLYDIGGRVAITAWAYATWRQIKQLSYYIRYQFIIVIIFADIILILMMLQRNKKKQEWSPQEVNLLQALHPEFTSKKWKRISEVFKAKGFNRSEIDCREKWINFVDPTINKKEWQEWELRRMYQIHSEMGTRWCFVQKEIGRTQNKIKNKFYGTLRNFIRFLLNYFDNGRSCLNYQITKLSPKFLNEMYNSENAFLYLNGEVKNAIFQMGFKVDKRVLTQRVRQNRTLYTKLHQFIVTTFQELNQHPPETSLMPSQSVSIMKEKQDSQREQQKMEVSLGEVESSVKRQDAQFEQSDLLRTSQSLSNVYMNSYESMVMMQYQQPSPQVYYYVLSYL